MTLSLWRTTGRILDRWTIVKDIVLTAGGLALIVQQALSPTPSDVFIITGLAMTGIGASFHVGAVLDGFIGRRGSPPPPPPGDSAGGSSPGAP